MEPIDGHQWAFVKDDPSMEIGIFDHKNSFETAMFRFSVDSIDATKIAVFHVVQTWKLLFWLKKTV